MFDFLSKADPILYYLGLSGLVKYAVYYNWKDRRPADAHLAGRVTNLMLYPFKSAKGIRVQEIQCSPEKGAFNGPIRDRHWMVVSPDHAMISSRQEPLISKIKTRIDGSKLILTASDQNDLTIDVTTVENLQIVLNTDVHSVPTKGLDCGEAASKWISSFLNKPGFRIVYCGSDIYRRGVVGGHKKYLSWTKIAKTEDKIAFHDSISFHLCAEESMADLNKRLDKPVDILRLRPNIVVSTEAKPFDEDTWKHVYIGDVRFKALKLCARCVLPTVDPETGLKDKDEEPLKTLRGYRQILPDAILGPAFGIDMIVEKPGTIKMGDPIYILRGDNITKP